MEVRRNDEGCSGTQLLDFRQLHQSLTIHNEGRKRRMQITPPFESLKGHLLLAMPALNDPNFYRTVTCLSEHSTQGSMGLVVNRRHDHLTAEEIFEELRLEFRPETGRLPIHIGGPVHRDELFLLHGPPFEWPGGFRINDFLALNNSLDLIRAVARGEGPCFCLICLGCAGWGPGQLEAELGQNAWLTIPADEEILFQTPVEERWHRAMGRLGVDPTHLTDVAGHA